MIVFIMRDLQLSAKVLNVSEHTEQAHLCQWMQMKGIVFFAVPNALKLAGVPLRTKFLIANHMKTEGMRKGVPDIIILTKPPLKPNANGIALELKAIKAKNHKLPCSCMSPEQVQWKHKFIQNGWIHILAHGTEDAISALESLGY